MRLTKFFETGGNDNKNIAELLLDISNNFIKLNENLEQMTKQMTKYYSNNN